MLLEFVADTTPWLVDEDAGYTVTVGSKTAPLSELSRSELISLAKNQIDRLNAIDSRQQAYN